MYTYIFKKLLRALFVLLSVVSIVYILQNASSIDPVEDFLLSSFGDKSYNSDQFRMAYEKEARNRNMHLPAFYFSIWPSYFPDRIFEMVHKGEKKFQKDLLRYSRCSTCVDQFLATRDDLIQNIFKNFDNKKILKSLAAKLKRERDLNKMHRLIEKMSNKLYQDSILIQDAKLLSDQWENLRFSENNSITFPKITWHGSHNRYQNYMTGLFSGEFGKSKTDGQSAFEKIIKALKWTLSINITSFILAGFIGLFLGLWSIKKNDSAIEKTISSLLYFWYTMPVFWSATLFVIFFTTKEYGAWTNLFPSAGIKYWYSDQPVYSQILLNAKQLILPVICITFPSLAYVSRLMKSKFSEVLSRGFITALRSKGIGENRILTHHVLKNGIIPFITIMTGSIPSLFAGSLVIEIIFNIPGIGKLLFDSILSNDWSVIGGLVIMLSIVTVLAYLLADILYSWANPKISVLNS